MARPLVPVILLALTALAAAAASPALSAAGTAKLKYRQQSGAVPHEDAEQAVGLRL